MKRRALTGIAAGLVIALIVAASSPATAALGDCGQPVSNGDAPTASDCLFILKAAVGAETCDCECDTNGSGAASASDSLLCLKVAVGQPEVLGCACAPPGFQIETLQLEVPPGALNTYCYYFRTPNTETLAVRRWASQMLPATFRMVVFLTVDANGDPIDLQPPGTLSSQDCGLGATPPPHWMYSAYTTAAELTFPAEDGSGKPLAAEIPPSSAGYILMHNLNPTDDVLSGGVILDAEALEPGEEFTETATFVTYDGSISLSPQSMNELEEQDCDTPEDASFWWLSTYTHNHSTSTRILDGLTTVFESTDFANPGAEIREEEPFVTFASGELTSQCIYDNFTNQTVTSGDSYTSSEVCMAIGYFFPAERTLWCFNGIGPF
ncbi:MAG TPA: hypothetical protein VEL28_16505 [Candidatus Binatia bacterium]|nr:hypothetical protein [Candidatus Binatia bacterium]